MACTQSGVAQTPSACATVQALQVLSLFCVSVCICRLQEEEPPKLYSVVCGSVTLLHGSASDPELQQLLQAARAEWAADEAAAADALAQQQEQQASSPADAADLHTTGRQSLEASAVCAGVSISTAASSRPASETDPDHMLCTADNSCCLECCAAGRHQTGLSHPGVWQRVMAAVSHNSRQQLQDSLDARAAPLTTAPSAHLQQHQPHQQQQQHTHTSHHTAPLNLQGSAAAAASLNLRLSDAVSAAERESSLMLSVAKRNQSFR